MTRPTRSLSASRRGVALALAAALALSVACGGKSTPAQPAAQTGPGAPAGSAVAAAATAAATSAASGSLAAGSGAATRTSGAAIDLCSLLTVEEAKATLGNGSMDPPKAGQYVASGSCHYQRQDAPLAVVVWIDTSATPAQARGEFEGERRFDDGQAVTGPGEAAYVTTKLSKKIVVLSGARRLHILIQPPSRATDEEVRASLTTLGRAAAARLP